MTSTINYLNTLQFVEPFIEGYIVIDIDVMAKTIGDIFIQMVELKRAAVGGLDSSIVNISQAAAEMAAPTAPQAAAPTAAPTVVQTASLLDVGNLASNFTEVNLSDGVEGAMALKMLSYATKVLVKHGGSTVMKMTTFSFKVISIKTKLVVSKAIGYNFIPQCPSLILPIMQLSCKFSVYGFILVPVLFPMFKFIPILLEAIDKTMLKGIYSLRMFTDFWFAKMVSLHQYLLFIMAERDISGFLLLLYLFKVITINIHQRFFVLCFYFSAIAAGYVRRLERLFSRWNRRFFNDLNVFPACVDDTVDRPPYTARALQFHIPQNIARDNRALLRYMERTNSIYHRLNDLMTAVWQIIIWLRSLSDHFGGYLGQTLRLYIDRLLLPWGVRASTTLRGLWVLTEVSGGAYPHYFLTYSILENGVFTSRLEPFVHEFPIIELYNNGTITDIESYVWILNFLNFSFL